VLFGFATFIVGAAAGCGSGGKPPGSAGGAGGSEEAPDAALAVDAKAVVPDAGLAADVAAAAGDVAVSMDEAPAAPDTGAGPSPDSAPVMPGDSVVWAIDNLQSIGGHKTTVLGSPQIIDTPQGKALQFDGVKDALFVDNHPLAGLSQFTVEIFFRPDPGGATAQRWFHMNENNGGRVLFETRLMGNSFAQDVFVESKGGNMALYDAKFTHPLGAWYHIAAVVDGKRAHHYVNGMEESNVALPWVPQGPGQTSIGVRITRMYYFKGAIRLARFTPRALTPAEFMKMN
jgi:hypothetical protein